MERVFNTAFTLLFKYPLSSKCCKHIGIAAKTLLLIWRVQHNLSLCWRSCNSRMVKLHDHIVWTNRGWNSCGDP